jgi:hypothetical protein
MKLTLQSVRIAAGPDEHGMLVFGDGCLVAVLVRLSDAHEGMAGEWFLETGYGPFAGPEHPIFPSLAEARAWIGKRLAEPRPR